MGTVDTVGTTGAAGSAGRWFDVPICSETTGSGRAERTRARLVRTAAGRFAESGYHATSLRDVLTEAGVTKGAVYFHFGSKIDLARAVCDEATRTWGVVLGLIAARGLDPLQEMLVQGDATLVRFSEDLPLRAALRVGAEAVELDGMLTRWRTGWEGRTTALCHRAHEQELLASWARPETLGRHLVALMLGHQAFGAHLPAPDDPWRRMSDSWDDVLSAIASPQWLAAWRASGWHERARPHQGTP